MIITEGVLSFNFVTNNGSFASKYDEWVFYRKHFCKIANTVKAVDFIYVDEKQKCTWLIEVKDYRHPHTESIKPSELADVVAIKIKDTLAGLAAAKCNANDDMEKQISKAALDMPKIKVVLHVEQAPRKWSIDLADLKTKLKQKLKSVDAHPKAVNKANLNGKVPWTVN